MIGLYLNVTQAFPKGNAPVFKVLSVCEFVDFPHEGAGVETEGVVALFEFVQFLNYRDGNYNVVVLKLLYGVIVVQDDVGVQDKDLGGGLLLFGHI